MCCTILSKILKYKSCSSPPLQFLPVILMFVSINDWNEIASADTISPAISAILKRKNKKLLKKLVRFALFSFQLFLLGKWSTRCPYGNLCVVFRPHFISSWGYVSDISLRSYFPFTLPTKYVPYIVFCLVFDAHKKKIIMLIIEVWKSPSIFACCPSGSCATGSTFTVFVNVENWNRTE